MRGAVDPYSNSWTVRRTRSTWSVVICGNSGSARFFRQIKLILETGWDGSGLDGKISQNSWGGGREYEVNVGISGHFFFNFGFVAGGGKKMEIFGFNHSSVTVQFACKPNATR